MTSPRRTPGSRGPGARSTPTGTGGRSAAPRRTATSRGASAEPSRSGQSRATPPRSAAGRAGQQPGAASRSAARPASARRAAAPGAARRTAAPQPNRLTGRATALLLVLGALLLAYAYPVRLFLNQQAQIAAYHQSQADQRRRIADKQTESDKFKDPNYIRALARTRLQMGRPGEVLYVVVGDSATASANPGTGLVKNTGPWYGQLWSSLQAADNPRPAP